MMYVRFLARPHGYRRCKQGIFRVDWDVSDRVAVLFRRELEDCYDWFNEHLTVPKLNDSRAVFWFKSNARESMRRAVRICGMMSLAGYAIEQRITRHPGFIVFEDKFQVAAVPPSLVGIEL